MENENKKIKITKSMHDFEIKSNNIKVIELLLKYQYKVKIFKKKGGYELLLTAYTEGRNVLMIASQSGNLDIIEILIENNIRINERDYDNKNALIYATEKGNLKLVQYLVKKKININVCSFCKGWNALFYAIDKNYNDMATYLIDNDIDMYGNNIKNRYSKNIVSLAYEKKNISLINYMIEKGINLDCKDYNGETELINACNNNYREMNNLKLIQLLVENGININEKDNEGDNALIIASMTSTLDIVKYLISKGIDVNAKNNRMYNALIMACEHNKFEIVKYLMECGIDILII
ncbi:ankyrin [Neocallimastix californiae]|uniref:Ankyrin n=1 Tax=Neocallimastix californiae TaxID=1754190 RepID=A0A1Y1Z4G1_9FUNG|nr:ankyrin [Neocallimastix californiae]|eukprot:ORY05139.1 ankyrin [Neocallimastix californiae]